MPTHVRLDQGRGVGASEVDSTLDCHADGGWCELWTGLCGQKAVLSIFLSSGEIVSYLQRLDFYI